MVLESRTPSGNRMACKSHVPSNQMVPEAPLALASPPPDIPVQELDTRGHGLDYTFIKEPDGSLKCRLCHKIAREPWQHGKCGKLFCKKCIDEQEKEAPCPACKTEDPQYFEDSRSKNDINVLEVKCTNFERGCKWVGAIIMFENHLENCGYHLVECPLGCKITGLLQHALDKHIKRKCPNREFYCQDCNFKDTYENITNAHELQCQKKIVLCPNPRCPESMEREKVNSHIEKECNYTMVTCKYESIGCEKKLEKYLMKEHEQDISSHIPLALTTLTKFQKYQQIATQSIESAHEAIRSLKFAIKSLTDIILVLKNRNDTPILNQGEAFTFKLTQFALKINTNNEFCSHPFYTSHRGYNMTIITNLRGGDRCDISVYVRMLQGEHDKELEWPFIGRVTFELLNQLADRKHHVKIINVGKDDDMQVSKGMGVTQFISHALLEYDPAEHTQYLKDDTLYFRITVESHSFKPWLECTTN